MTDINVDCDWLVTECTDCCHPKRSYGWRKLWHLKCTEYAVPGFKCNYRESIWDVLKEENAKEKANIHLYSESFKYEQ